MATISLRQVAQQCLGLTGSISVNSDVYGYIFRDTDGSVFGTLGTNDTLPGSGQPTQRSLKRHLQTISGKSAELVLILVGHEDDFSGSVSRDDVTKIQYAVQVARDMYAQVNLGIRVLDWRKITPSEANGHINITDGAEAEDLTDEWSASGGGVDVFWVQSIGDAGGWSNVEGPCDKDSKDGRTGAVIEVSGSRRFTGVLLAHEVGHYLGLSHGNDMTNIMGADTNNDGIGEINSNSTGVTSGQGTNMKNHCSILGGCA